MDLFSSNTTTGFSASISQPLAERMRPSSLDDFVGQKHLVEKGAILRNIIESGNIPSMIFWGPPGVGKTTLANIIANQLKKPFQALSAISSGVKDVRETINRAKAQGSIILFIDEIHRFNKSQQDALLGAVEKGYITLIGATTENPSFEVNSALLSRCQVYVLKHIDNTDILHLIETAMHKDHVLKDRNIDFKESAALLQLAGGDARKSLNLFELIVNTLGNNAVVTDKAVTEIAQQKTIKYDKDGDMHYDIISAFIKSIRGSDPNAAVYWLARMIEGGEDVKFIARRLLILASEDIGNANPTALVIANNAFQAVNVIGFPESRIILSQTAIYLASSTKSNACYEAINKAQALVKETGNLSVPFHIRNAPTKLMKDMGHGEGYKYSHAYDGNFEVQEYLPEEIKNIKLYEPSNNARENEIRKNLKNLWGTKYNY